MSPSPDRELRLRRNADDPREASAALARLYGSALKTKRFHLLGHVAPLGSDVEQPFTRRVVPLQRAGDHLSALNIVMSRHMAKVGVVDQLLDDSASASRVARNFIAQALPFGMPGDDVDREPAEFPGDGLWPTDAGRRRAGTGRRV